MSIKLWAKKWVYYTPGWQLELDSKGRRDLLAFNGLELCCKSCGKTIEDKTYVHCGGFNNKNIGCIDVHIKCADAYVPIKKLHIPEPKQRSGNTIGKRCKNVN